MVKQIILASTPTGLPVPELGKPDSTFELKQVELPELKENQVLIQTLYISNDPAQRGWIASDVNPDRHYVSPTQPGQIMPASGIGRVLKSTSPSIKEGSLVQTSTGWTEQRVVDAKSVHPIPNLPGFKPSVFLGALGVPGLTAYFGLKDVCKLEEGQKVIISAAAGATGNVAVQLAKNVFKASKVIAIAGSDEKCEWLKKIGADVALNYKSSSFHSDLAAAAGPSFVDCYFDNVGGDILDTCLTLIKKNGRVAACGAISTYNGDSLVLKNWAEIILCRIIIEGFIVLDYYHRRDEAINVLTTAVKEGKLVISEAETLVPCPEFGKIPEIWMRLFSGKNTGKLVTQVADL
ncbi:NAD(P)-binding protein [Rhodocollybia butyracea]|uniref:NAD(P)-binding protein n=1 Tax=Rhodocollybia butyracea TaxID=206335 RepID=A0A9P5QBI0_9AGAR|nr:NAD(P)-binding protein [Rhodocollybia butyracea]